MSTNKDSSKSKDDQKDLYKRLLEDLNFVQRLNNYSKKNLSHVILTLTDDVPGDKKQNQNAVIRLLESIKNE